MQSGGRPSTLILFNYNGQVTNLLIPEAPAPAGGLWLPRVTHRIYSHLANSC